MKNIFKYIFLVTLTSVFLTSCEDEDLNPLLEQVPAPFVFLELDSPVIDVTDIQNSTYGGTLIAPAGNVVSYEATVRRVSGGVSTDYEVVYSTTTFPATFNISAVDVADALGLDPDDLLPGDRFDFVATSVGVDGTVVTFNNLAPDMQVEAGQKQAYQLTTYISCPFVRDDVLGTWELVDGGFAGPVGHQFEVIASPDASDEIILINPFDSPQPSGSTLDPDDQFRPRIKIDPFGIAELPSDTSVDPANPNGYEYFDSAVGCCGNRFAPTRMTGDGFVFSCSGFMTFTSNDSSLEEVNPPTGALFSWTGDPNLVAQKVN